jgi:integrase
VASLTRLLASPAAAVPAVRLALVAKLGRIRSRTRGEDGAREFYLDFRPIGRVWSNRGIRITDEATAQRLLDRIRDEVAEGVPVEVVVARYQPTDSPTNLVPTWLRRWIELRRREADAGSLSPLYADELERLAAPGGHFSFFDRISIHEVSFGTLEDWSLWLADRSLGPKSRHLYLSYFRTFLRWLERRGEIPRVPQSPRVKVAEYEPKLLSIADQDLVLAQIPEPDRGLFLALAHLGLRPGEARALEVGDYHDGWITVDKAVKGKVASSPVRGTKTGKPKRLPVSEEMRSWIERHVDRTGRLQRAPLFPNPRTGDRWPHKALCRVWDRAVAAAGLPHIGLYEGTKHSFATDAIRRGVPERHLQRFLGHASVTSTRRYARLADNAMLEVLRNPAKPARRQAGDKGPKTQVPDFTSTSGWALLDSNQGRHRL